MSIIQGNTKVSAGGTTIDQSLRFNDDDSAYLTDTLGTATDSNRWTYSVWVKRGALPGTIMSLINSNFAGNDAGFLAMSFDTNNTFYMTGWTTRWRQTSQVFRDPSAWYHIIVAVDTDQGVANDRIKIYVNGSQITSFSTTNNPSSGANLGLNQAAAHEIGRDNGGIRYFDGYMAEINFIDGQALAPTDFGEFNDDGVWIAKRFAGAYGNNGFYLTGEDSADLGADYSGNGNDFTSSGLTTADQVTDTPTENYCVLNVLNEYGTLGTMGCSDGNLRSSPGGASTNKGWRSTIGPTSGKWYCEATFTATLSDNNGGVALTTGSGIPGETSDPTGIRYMDYGNWRQNGVTVGLLAGIYVNDVVMMAFDVDAGKVWFGKNGSWYASGDPANGLNPISTTCPSPAFPASYHYNNNAITTWNFGQLGFTYTPPTGFSALSTANLPEPTIKDGSAHFNAITYTGDGTTSRTITGVGFQPDLVWIKCRSNTESNILTDAVRGISAGRLKSDSTAAEESQSSTPTATLSGFDSDGFVGPSSTPGNINVNSRTYVARNWLAGNGTASNTDGTITSTVSANQTAGFSIVSYTGNGTAGATVGHGLGVAPDMLIVKNRDGTEQWIVYHQYNGGTKYLLLNAGNAVATSSGAWNNTDPSSTVVTLGGGGFGTNVSSNAMIMYAFAEVEGFSKFGKYIGNGNADGPFAWCGFRPAFIMVKNINQAVAWGMFDNKRIGYNADNFILYSSNTNAETTTQFVDFLSNGFKLRRTGQAENVNGNTHIFMAFAEHPFKYANAR